MNLAMHTVAYMAEQFQMTVRSNKMETIINIVPIVRTTAAGF